MVFAMECPGVWRVGVGVAIDWCVLCWLWVVMCNGMIVCVPVGAMMCCVFLRRVGLNFY